MHGTSPGEVSFPVSSFGGLVALAVPESLPENASPRTWNCDYLVGQVKTRDGLSSIYLQSTSNVGPNTASAGSSSTWNSAVAVTSAAGFASFSPVSSANDIFATEFEFALTPNISAAGFTVSLTAYGNAQVTLTAQLVVNGLPVGSSQSVILGTAPTLITLGNLWGLTLTNDQINATNFGVHFIATPYSGFTGATAFIQNVKMTIAVNTGQQVMQPLETWTDQKGNRYNLVMDGAGDLWVENLDTAPNTLNLTRTGISAGSLAVQCEGEAFDYLAFTKPGTLGGNDMPLEWSPTSQNRITQVGPGQSPIFTPSQASTTSYPITSITQPPAAVDPNTGLNYTFTYFLQSAGPGSNQPGNVITIYYGDSTNTPPNTDLVNTFNSGQPVYIYVSTSGFPTTVGPYVQQVTAVGEASPPGQPRSFFYFSYNVPSVAYTFYAGSGHPTYSVAWQRTLATLSTTTPIPNVVVNSEIAVTGVTPTNWNATWTVTQTPNASEMVITGTQVTSGVATFNYAVTNGTPAPAAGELVTIVNTLNAGGVLNVTQWPIATATGGSTGSFTVNGFAGSLTAPFEAENGYATTAGTIFDFDPGAALVGTSTNPIFGNAGAGGDVVFNSTGVFIDPGTYQGTCFFILPDGSFTQPSPPVVFTVPENTTNIIVNNLVLGPPNVVGRGIAITEAGQNGVPGANFFTLEDPVVFYNQGTKLTATSFLVNDNSTTNVSLFFTSSALNRATAIDVYGFNLFNCEEIGDPAWIVSYSSRNWYGQCLNRVQNLLNMSFDGGYLASTGRKVPAGWQAQDVYGTLDVSPRFGDAWYVKNTGLVLPIVATQMTSGTATYTYTPGVVAPSTGALVTVTGTTNGSGVFNVTNAAIATVNVGSSTFTVTGLSGTFGSQPETGSATIQQAINAPFAVISQTAYQDAYQQNILQPNTGYSVRVWARTPSGAVNGSLVVALTAGSVVLGSVAIPLGSMTTAYQRFIEVILPDPGIVSIPTTAQVQVYAENLAYGGDVETDRIEIFPTDIPVLVNTVFASYAGEPTMVDAVTGQVVFASENQQPVQMATVLYDTFYAMKGWSGTAPGSSLYSLQASSGFEPADWNEPEVAQRSGGAVGPFAWDGGEQWLVSGSRAGLYLFFGGQPGKITQELQPIWDSLAWSEPELIAGMAIDIDLKARRILIGAPMETPNFWLPNAPVMITPPHIESVQVFSSGGRAPSTLVVTFTQPLPALQPEQTYTFSGLTSYTALNGQTLSAVIVSGSTARFFFDPEAPNYSAPDTGTAVISGTSVITGNNVWLMCNFQGLDSGEELRAEPQMHTTMFGALAAIDMRRKWNIWYSATNAGTVARVQGLGGEETRFGNGIGNSKVYKLDPTMTTDDGNAIDSCYTTAGFPILSKRQDMQQLGPNRVRWTYFIGALQSGGTLNLRLLGNRLFFPEPNGYVQWTVPGGFAPTLTPISDSEATLNFPASRTFLEFRENDGFGWTLSNVTLRGRKDVWNAMTGKK